MEKSIGKFIFFFLFLCGVWWSFYALIDDNQWRLALLNNDKGNYHYDKSSQFDALFCDSIKAYLKHKNPNLTTKYCDSILICDLYFLENMSSSKDSLLYLNYYVRENTPPKIPNGQIDSLPYDYDIRMLYSKLHNKYIVLSLKDLAEEKSRYNLQSFLRQNEIEVKDAKQLFYYFYRVYNDFEFNEGYTCGYPHYYSIHNFKDIPINVINAMPHQYYVKQSPIYNAYFRSKVRTTLEAYQKEANHYFCGVILNLNKSKGQWTMYLLVVNDKNPLDYKIHVFTTPPDKDYTWKGIRTHY